jgi:class 3 adenylate cyclase
MATKLRTDRARTFAAREDRLRVLRSMLPDSIAERVASGDLRTIDAIPQATVVAVVILGLGELVRADNTDRELVDRLHAELDGLAVHHGLDRINVVGDTYAAACGHDQPYIDHAPRALAFATDARRTVQEATAASPASIDESVGVDTGPVFVGMSGSSRLVYDVWGQTVAVAHQVARRARPGEVLVTESTRNMLPPTIEVEERETDPTGDGDNLWEVRSGAPKIGGRET